ncbi:MAG: NUMOD4 motif-containing HNH endonuclease [Agathobacter sp.]|nr:NUMOD4 motif-containing HNH endonuclease [Agathobacter sp.]
MENWKDIFGYEGLYQVSDQGRIKSLERWVPRTGQTPKLIPETIIRLKEGAYYRVNLHKDGKMKTFLVHRIVAAAFIPNPNGYKIVNHKDGNKHNNVVENLEFCTSRDNNRHAREHGLHIDNINGLLNANKENSIIVQCYKEGKLLHTDTSSKQMALWLKDNQHLEATTSAIARAVRSYSQSEKVYHGMVFKRLNDVQSPFEPNGCVNIISNGVIIYSCATTNEAAEWLITTKHIDNACIKTVARAIRQKINKNIPYHKLFFTKI